MPYYGTYRGDYRTYGYAQGDPGFLSSLWKGVKKVGKIALGTAIGGPIGGVIAGVGIPGQTPPTFPGVGQQQFPRMPMPPSPKMTPPVMGFRGPTPPLGRGPGVGAVAPTNGCCPSGYHLDKATGTKCVRNRRMNVANPRALRRSIRRIQGFEKLVRRTFTVSGAVKVKKGRR